MIHLQNITLAYSNTILFQGMSVHIKKGYIMLLHAPSGSGKSSFIRMLLGFVYPQQGTITINSMPMNKYTLKKIRSKIAYVSQDIDLRNDTLINVCEEIFTYPANKHIAFSRNILLKYMEEFHLDASLLDTLIHDLSGGERQRVGLIICLLLQREIWLLDEITAALDEHLIDIVVDKVMNSGKTVIVISHDRVWQEQQGIQRLYLPCNLVQ